MQGEKERRKKDRGKKRGKVCEKKEGKMNEKQKKERNLNRRDGGTEDGRKQTSEGKRE